MKIGDFKTGGLESRLPSQEPSIFSEDCFRFRVRWTELQFILDEVHQLQSTDSKAALSPRFPKSISDFVHSGSAKDNAIRDLDNLQRAVPTRSLEVFQQPVTSIIFSRFTFDFQRVFKESRSQAARDSPERTQISLIVHDVLIKDLTPDSKFPVVFDCTSNTSFFDLCIRARGPLDADLIQIDLFDLNLEHAKGISEKMILTTSESYVWRLLDLANRILAASGDFAGIALKLEEDKEHGGFVVKIEESQASKQRNDTKKYTPPKGDKLFVVDLARVSPFTLLVSFQRDPQSSRYRKNQNAWGHSLMNYFTRRLKFTIERAELNFARYEDRTLRGPPDRLMETLGAVYMSRMKFKLVTLLSASTLQDWKYLAARDTGDDAYVEGDILRATGNLAGKSASIVFKRAASGLASGVTGLTDAVGNNIERGTEKIGAGRVGAGVNSVITGVGDGVGETLLGGKSLSYQKLLLLSFVSHWNFLHRPQSQWAVALERS